MLKMDDKHMPVPDKPLRILHVLYKLDMGGLEKWLMTLLRHIDRRVYQLDFLVHHPDPGVFDEEAKSYGARVIYCPYSPWPWKYSRSFLRLLRQHGPYDVIHSHLALSGAILLLAHRAGIPGRIAHSHTDEASRLSRAGLARRVSLFWSHRWIRHYATTGLAASRVAARGRFGAQWEVDPRWRILSCGVDLTPFHQSYDREQVRRGLGIPPQALVLGNVGRFVAVKNHDFLVEIAAALRQRESNFYLLLVGDGPRRQEMQQRVKDAGLEANVIFTGFRSDLPRLLSAMDAFLFPSLFEGLGLAVVEAQAAGLPCLISTPVPREAEVVPSLVRRLALSESAAAWAEAALAAVRARDSLPPREEALERVSISGFNVINSIRALERLYAGYHPDLRGNCQP
jgi:glycosyltransferase involved in cell wall biosynthesis